LSGIGNRCGAKGHVVDEFGPGSLWILGIHRALQKAPTRPCILVQLWIALLAEIGCRVVKTGYVAITRENYAVHSKLLARFEFALHRSSGLYVAEYSQGLEKFLLEETPIRATVYIAKPRDSRQRLQFESVNYWYWEHLEVLSPRG
jgi:hypothetical protein